MLCPKCKKEIDAESKFCGFCGNNFDETVCGKCGAKNPLDHNFCKSCGGQINKNVKVDSPTVDEKKDGKSKKKVEKCPGCGAEVTSENTYCDRCILNSVWTCQQCGTKMMRVADKCPKCGHGQFENSEQKEYIKFFEDAHQKENIKEEEGGWWGAFCTLGLMFCILSFFAYPHFVDIYPAVLYLGQPHIIFCAIGIAFGILGIYKEEALGGFIIIIVCAISIFLSYQATAKLQRDALQQSQQLLQQHQEWKKSIGLR